MTHEIQIAPSTYLNTQITRRINVSGIDVDEGLHPNSVLKHNNILNAMINMAFKHLNIDRLSPFRGLQIRGEGENTRPIPNITKELISGCTSIGYIAWSRQRVAQSRNAQKLTQAATSIRQGIWWMLMLSHPEQEPEATQLQKPHVQACIHWPAQGLQWHSTALGWKHHWTRARSIWLCCVWNSWLFLGTKAWGDSQGSDLRTLEVASTKPVGAIPKIGYWTRSRTLYPSKIAQEIGSKMMLLFELKTQQIQGSINYLLQCFINEICGSQPIQVTPLKHASC